MYYSFLEKLFFLCNILGAAVKVDKLYCISYGVGISRATYVGSYNGDHLGPWTLCQTQSLTTNEYIAIFKVKNSLGDIFAVSQIMETLQKGDL